MGDRSIFESPDQAFYPKEEAGQLHGNQKQKEILKCCPIKLRYTS